MFKTVDPVRAELRRARRAYFGALIRYASLSHMDVCDCRAPAEVLESLAISARLEEIFYLEQRRRRARPSRPALRLDG